MVVVAVNYVIVVCEYDHVCLRIQSLETRQTQLARGAMTVYLPDLHHTSAYIYTYMYQAVYMCLWCWCDNALEHLSYSVHKLGSNFKPLPPTKR